MCSWSTSFSLAIDVRNSWVLPATGFLFHANLHVASNQARSIVFTTKFVLFLQAPGYSASFFFFSILVAWPFKSTGYSRWHGNHVACPTWRATIPDLGPAGSRATLSFELTSSWFLWEHLACMTWLMLSSRTSPSRMSSTFGREPINLVTPRSLANEQ